MVGKDENSKCSDLEKNKVNNQIKRSASSSILLKTRAAAGRSQTVIFRHTTQTLRNSPYPELLVLSNESDPRYHKMKLKRNQSAAVAGKSDQCQTCWPAKTTEKIKSNHQNICKLCETRNFKDTGIVARNSSPHSETADGQSVVDGSKKQHRGQQPLVLMLGKKEHYSSFSDYIFLFVIYTMWTVTIYYFS